MKRLKYILIICLVIVSFVGCSKKDDIKTDNLEAMTICELEQIENVSNLNDETIKALAVVIRTNLKDNVDTNFAYIPNNKRIADLVYSTKGEIIQFDENNNYEEDLAETSLIINDYILKDNKINYSFNQNETWTVKIKKYQILKYLNKHNINLSNISNIEPVYTDENSIESIKIGSKNITYNELAKEFGLKSNKIINIENNLSEIIITGLYDKNFNIDKANDLANEGKTYDKILESILKTYKISKD